MTLDRRTLLAAGTALLTSGTRLAGAGESPTTSAAQRQRRIATEEAYAVPELVDGVRSQLKSGAKLTPTGALCPTSCTFEGDA